MQPQRETVIYAPGSFKGLAAKQYTKDLKRRQKQGWQLVSCTESGKNWAGQTILTAIYERGDALPAGLNLPNLPILLSMLSPEERAAFESEVAAVVHRWLARKAQG